MPSYPMVELSSTEHQVKHSGSRGNKRIKRDVEPVLVQISRVPKRVTPSLKNGGRGANCK